MRTIAGNGSSNSQLQLPDTLSACKTTARAEGFKDTFSLTTRGLYSLMTSRYYRPEQVTVHRTIHISSNENPLENGTVHMIETVDGVRGVLTEPAGSNSTVSGFIAEAETISRQMKGLGPHQC